MNGSAKSGSEAGGGGGGGGGRRVEGLRWKFFQREIITLVLIRRGVTIAHMIEGVESLRRQSQNG